MEPLASLHATGIIGGLIPITSASLSAASLMTIVITTVIEAIADLVVPDFHPGFMVLGRGGASPANQLRQSVHLAGKELAFRCSPSTIAFSLMLDDFQHGHGLTVRRGKLWCARSGDGVHSAPPFPSSGPTASKLRMCLHRVFDDVRATESLHVQVMCPSSAWETM